MATVTVFFRDGEGDRTFHGAEVEREHDEHGKLTEYRIRHKGGEAEIPASTVLYVQVSA